MTPTDVLVSLLDAIGTEGTLVLPTFTYDGWCHGESFNVDTTPSRMGALTEAGRLFPGAIRTGNPMYSFVAIGKRAGDFFHWDNKAGYGSPSPFSWLRNPDVDGKIAVIDLDDQRSMTYYHHVEEVMRVPYRYYKDFPGKWTGWDGIEKDKTYQLYVRDLELGWKTNVNPMGELLWRKDIWKGDRPGVGDGMRVCLAEDVFFMTQQIIVMGYERKFLGYIDG